MIKMEIKGMNELISNMGQAGGMVEPLVRSALNKSATTIKYHAKENAPTAFGKLKGSIKHNVFTLSAVVWASEKYAPFVEFGTRPHMPPIEPLKKWAALKLGNEGLAWAVAKKISREGTKAQPFFKPAVEESVSDIQTNFRILADQLLKIMGK